MPLVAFYSHLRNNMNEWIYLTGSLVIGYCAYYSGKADGLNLGIEHTLMLLEKNRLIDCTDPRFDKIFKPKTKAK
jgi:hypothetical protein